jgi:hypothetical protein
MPHTLRPLDPDTQYAALQERVYGLGQQFTHFEQATTRSFQQVESALATLSAELRAGGKTQWQTIVTSVGVLVAILGSLGALAYLPIRNGMDQLAAEARLLRDTTVPRSEHAERWRRTDEDIKSLEAAIIRNQDRIVPRGEHEEKWRSNERHVADLQRQIDELRRQQLDRAPRR